MQKEMKDICFAGFTDEERRAGEELIKRVNENMVRFMVKEEPLQETAEPGQKTAGPAQASGI